MLVTSVMVNSESSMKQYPHRDYRRVCYAEVEYPDGRKVLRHVVVFDKCGRIVSFYPLEKEEPFTEWRNECFVVTKEMIS